MLFTTTEEIQEYFPLEKNTSFNTLKSFIQQAEDEYIVKVLGPDMLSALQDYFDDSDPPDDAMEELLNKVREALTPLMLYAAAPVINIRWSDIGLMKTESNDYSAASGGEVYFARVQLLLAGYRALEALYLFLEQNEEDYDDWVDSEAYTEFKAFLVNKAEQFQEHVDINHSRWLFSRMVPAMDTVELLRIRPAIGDEFFEEIKEDVQDGAFTDTEEKHVLKLLTKSIALFTYSRCLEDPTIRETIRIVNAKTAEELSNKGFAAEDYSNQYKALSEQTKSEGEAIMAQLIKYLNAKASDTLFNTWFESDKYKDPAQNTAKIENYHNDSSESSFVQI